MASKAELKTELARYELGNCLRGWFAGEFASDDEAWEVLSDRFNRSWPSRGGREVELKRTIRVGKTAGGNETEQQRISREKIERILAEES